MTAGPRRSSVVITPGLADGAIGKNKPKAVRPPRLRLRAVSMYVLTAAAFIAVGGQLVRLASIGQDEVRSNMSTPIATAFSRPDVVDRNGRLLATDVVMPSLFADPTLVLDRNEVSEQLAMVFPDIDRESLRADLADTSKRFVWLRRAISPATAQLVNELGLPGLDFRYELKRAYPAGRVAGHILGYVNIDNKGLSGVERYIDDAGLIEPVHAATLSNRAPVRLALDIGVQHAVEEELADAMSRYGAKAASAVVIDVVTGEIVASSSLPGVDPLLPQEAQEPARRDRLANGTYELGSVFKAMTVAMALDAGLARAGSMIDVSRPLEADGYSIKDAHSAGPSLSVSDVFVRSSNVGSGVLGLSVGADRQRAYLKKFGLLDQLSTEAGAVSLPDVPRRWQDVETVTISYGHGLAVAPLQFAVASAALVNGGVRIAPTFLRQPPKLSPDGVRVLKPGTSAQIRRMMRENVTASHGTGGRADVEGYEVGGKTGTAEIPGRGGYQEKSVIASFLGAFPMSSPRYLTFVSLFEPQPVAETNNQVTAGRNAAPTTARIVKRIAPLLGVMPKSPKA